ncbi:hypothetical protein JXB02_03150 [Candidatus Woesearchaeota archaeon]|nr:hypothetical protein [Candidatus Woesearchaeota archaeon]
MERFQVEREKAKKAVKLADHMLTVTYPIVRDPKLLVSILSNIMTALEAAVSAILYYERTFKRIPPFPDEFEAKFDLFKARCTRRYSINIEYIALIADVRSLLKRHKASPIEFSRKETFVICSDTYSMATMSHDQLKRYIAKTKLFIEDMIAMVSKNERLFG